MMRRLFFGFLGLLVCSVLLSLAAHADTTETRTVKTATGDGFMLEFMVLEQPFVETMSRVDAAAALGARHFIIPVMLCQDSRTANAVHWCESQTDVNLPTVEITSTSEQDRLERLTTLAKTLKARGFTTGLLPFLLSADGAWRGTFEPQDFKAWAKSYSAMLDKLANVATVTDVDEFVVGSEYVKLYVPSWPTSRKEHAKYWTYVLNHFREQLNSRVDKHVSVFAIANWDQFDQIPFWDASDYIGLSSYFPLTNSISADSSVAALVKGWLPWAEKLYKLSQSVKRPLYFAEVGYSARRDAPYRPWYYEAPAELDLDVQSRLFRAFGTVWGTKEYGKYASILARFTIWALSRSPEPLKDWGYTVLDKPASAAVAEVFQKRAQLAVHLREIESGDVLTPTASDTAPIDVVFTMDDIPMWFVTAPVERIEAYASFRKTFVEHRVPAVAFLNPAAILEEREWAELRSWRDAGITLANHTANHLARSQVSESAFFMDVESAAQRLNAEVPGWDSHFRFFRYPNLDWGSSWYWPPNPASTPIGDAAISTCQQIRSRGYQILPMSFDSRDWATNEAYHKATLSARGAQSPEAKRIATQMLTEIDSQFQKAKRQHRSNPVLQNSALIFLIHSTRFTRNYLPEVLSRLERAGAHWVAPDSTAMQAYQPESRCLPVCLEAQSCH